ncbi:MAG: peptide deformylase [Anaerolineae bacterium]
MLLLGNPVLYQPSAAVTAAEAGDLAGVVADLHDTLMAFRVRYGVGRAIAAPQIGVAKRLIYVNVGEPMPLFNPVVCDPSDEMMAVWDDCMCFPDLLVQVNRHRRCRVEYRDSEWRLRSWPLEGDLAELLQHEIDHLDGILAVERAIDGRSFALRAARP